MSTREPLLDTIEPDVPTLESRHSNAHRPPLATNPNDAESGITGILKQSAHPAALFCLYFFRVAAIAVYVLCGLFTNDYVLSTIAVVVLLAMDFWNCRNVAGRTLVGLRFWNQVRYRASAVYRLTSAIQVDEDGESYWVFESRDPSRPANPMDSRWIALYAFPAFWLLLLVISIVRFNLAFVPIVILALVFNVTNAVGFTYADRDAKQRLANSVAGASWTMGMGGLGGQLFTSAVKNSVGKLFE
ncbi:DUF846-domain-containing protein [Lanmaoa asiatica]|nr:DUF846-domain-containing protein [Lanmaoa asiatica]